MNRTLLLANAIALAILVAFHFAPDSTEPVAQRMPHYLQVQKAPQWAVLSDQGSRSQEVSAPLETSQAKSIDRLVF
ncbi:hypothetical protein DXT77_13560 [Pseudomonas sp. 91RF]|jgi:hypothetical protein|uniref:hypothetical protein n=1 Tax=Pseudomonas sp. 91RF TaxID=2292261 RepID=UPI000E6734E8|nr:hypothetical protein [Pseudomonas sp. 91RF]RIJ10783.1 hypothetical protein DXT77_13560 [Pseudomonas sp. 91RF]